MNKLLNDIILTYIFEYITFETNIKNINKHWNMLIEHYMMNDKKMEYIIEYFKNCKNRMIIYKIIYFGEIYRISKIITKGTILSRYLLMKDMYKIHTNNAKWIRYYKYAPIITFAGYKFSFINDYAIIDYTDVICKSNLLNGLGLQYIPLSNKTYEICMMAVRKRGYNLEYVPDIYKTMEICEMAVIENAFALEFVPEKYKTKKLCKIAIDNKALSIQYVPTKIKDKYLKWRIINLLIKLNIPEKLWLV